MPRHRSLTKLLSRCVWLMLVVGVLAARGLTPDGWMPVADAAGDMQFAPCDGMGPIEPAKSMSMSHGKMHHQAPAKGQPSDHPCTGAGINLADATPSLPAIITPLRPMLTTAGIEHAVNAPGRGLAAPPPPATGPPTLA